MKEEVNLSRTVQGPRREDLRKSTERVTDAWEELDFHRKLERTTQIDTRDPAEQEGEEGSQTEPRTRKRESSRWWLGPR